jgi:hypothetical protein
VCGACGSGVVRAPWEVALAGGAAADLRRRADVAAALTEGRVRVRPWGPAGYLLQPRTAPVQAVASLEPLAAALHRHLRPGLPGCTPCGHGATTLTIALPDEYDVQRLAVWVALVRTGAGTGSVEVEAHAGSPAVALTGPHADELGAGLASYLRTGRLTAPAA